MSRSISISYRSPDGGDTLIETTPPYDLLGGQRSSMQFWSIPRLREVGIERLSDLGVMDPVIFNGWDEMETLRREIDLLGQHLPSIDFDLETKAAWLSHLVYCYHVLVATAPKESEPVFMIG